jgi:hypothetical protein
MKVALFLEESGLPYEAIPVDTRKGEQHAPAFIALNPNAKVPVIVDGASTVFDSNAILLYLAQKTGQFLPTPEQHGAMLSWLMFVASGIGPFTGQCVHFKHYAPEPNPYALNRYDFEAWRHWKILDAHLAGRTLVDEQRPLHAAGHGGVGLGARRALRSGRRGLAATPPREAPFRRRERAAGGPARRGAERPAQNKLRMYMATLNLKNKYSSGRAYPLTRPVS